MDLLFVSVRAPGPTDPRTYHLIEALAQRGNLITLVCGATPQEEASLTQLRRLCKQVLTAPVPALSSLSAVLRVGATGLPLAAAAGLNPQLIALVQAAARANPHAVAHLAGLAAAPLGVALRRLPAVLDLGHCASMIHLRTLMGTAKLHQRVHALFDLGRTRRYEAQLGRQFERLIAATSSDAWALRTLARELGAEPQAPIRVLADGVDLKHFAPQPVHREPNRLVLSGIPLATADPAIDFIGSEVMPRVWRARADVHLTLVGVPVTPSVRTLTRDPRVTLLPTNADRQPALAQATLACIPPFPTPGLPTSALEALAMGTPVVAIVQAAQDTQLSDGHDLVLAADATAYATAVLALLDDPSYRGRLGRAGRRYVEQNHNWNDAAAEAEQIYAAAMGAEIADWRLDMGLHRRILTPSIVAD